PVAESGMQKGACAPQSPARAAKSLDRGFSRTRPANRKPPGGDYVLPACRPLVPRFGRSGWTYSLFPAELYVAAGGRVNFSKPLPGQCAGGRPVLLLGTIGLVGDGGEKAPLPKEGQQYVLAEVVPVVEPDMLLDLFPVAGNLAELQDLPDALVGIGRVLRLIDRNTASGGLHGTGQSLHGGRESLLHRDIRLIF